MNHFLVGPLIIFLGDRTANLGLIDFKKQYTPVCIGRCKTKLQYM